MSFPMSSTCGIWWMNCNLYLAHMALSSTAKCGFLVYSRIVPFSLCYIISQITWEWWRTAAPCGSILLSKMEAWLWQGDLQKLQTSLRLTSLRFMMMEINSAKGNGCKSNCSNLIKWLFQNCVCTSCTASSVKNLFRRFTKIDFPRSKIGLPLFLLISSILLLSTCSKTPMHSIYSYIIWRKESNTHIWEAETK